METRDDFEPVKSLSLKTDSKILLLVMDGLGGLPNPDTGKTELETARTPNLDKLVSSGIGGLIETVGPGITPGSAPGHLGIFGYDPLKYLIGRGVLEAMGIGADLQHGDVAARGNFCTVDSQGIITDRRAGRIKTEQSTLLCRKLDGMEIEGIKIEVIPLVEHRFVVIFRQLHNGKLSESDPQRVGVKPAPVEALEEGSRKAAVIVSRFIEQAQQRLSGEKPANMLLLRGFDMFRLLPSFQDVYKLNPAVVAAYPMYRGLACLAGMKVIDVAGNSIEDELEALERVYQEHDFVFLHIKGTDSAGEDGDFERKVKVIESVDSYLPRLNKLAPDVIVVTGDHSTPARLNGHSWHPVPFLLSASTCRPDRVKQFSEADCATGCLGCFPATRLMTLAMAHALKLAKYGA